MRISTDAAASQVAAAITKSAMQNHTIDVEIRIAVIKSYKYRF